MGSRVVYPGEVDHEIDRTRLYSALAYEWDEETVAACDAVYERHVSPALGLRIPGAVFCDLPKATFLDYLVQRRSVLLMGSNRGDLARLEPVVLSQNLLGWNTPRYVAFKSSIEAIYHAVLDVTRLARLGYSSRSTLALSDGFYFGLDYRVAGEAPWRRGTVYLYRSSDFPEDFLSKPYWTDSPILPSARIEVTPSDWPMLGHVCGVNMNAQVDRQGETFLGYPWQDDELIHPARWKEPLARALQNYLDANDEELVGLERLSKIIHASPTATLRIFRAVMGQSPRDYQTGRRISAARRLLRKGTPIGQVAAETGFYDQTHMTHQFKRSLGLTPGQYLRTQESPMR